MKNNLIFLTILVLGFFLFRTYFWDSDKKQINKILNEIQESLKFEKSLPPLSVLGRLKTISSHLAPNFSASVLEDGKEKELKVLSNMENLKGIALAGSRHLTYLDLFLLTAIIDVTNKQASASFHVTITGQDTQSGKFKELFSVEIKLLKIEGNWLIQSIKADRLTPQD